MGTNTGLEDQIHTAVDTWFADPAAAKAKYGPIASWDVSEVTDLDQLFADQTAFKRGHLALGCRAGQVH